MRPSGRVSHTMQTKIQEKIQQLTENRQKLTEVRKQHQDVADEAFRQILAIEGALAVLNELNTQPEKEDNGNPEPKPGRHPAKR
jgi:chromosome segregation ATPase